MFFHTDYGGQVLTFMAAMLSIAFWEGLHHVGVVIVIVSGLVGLSLGIARTIDFVNDRYDGNLRKYLRYGFKLKKTTKKTK